MIRFDLSGMQVLALASSGRSRCVDLISTISEYYDLREISLAPVNTVVSTNDTSSDSRFFFSENFVLAVVAVH